MKQIDMNSNIDSTVRAEERLREFKMLVKILNDDELVHQMLLSVMESHQVVNGSSADISLNADGGSTYE